MNKKFIRKSLILVAILCSFLLINASTGSAIAWGELTPRLEYILKNTPDSWSADIISKINLIHNRLAYIAQNPLPNLWIFPEVAEQALGILDRITVLLSNTQPGRSFECHTYPETGHWFFEEDRAEAFKPEAPALAWTRTLDFLKQKMG